MVNPTYKHLEDQLRVGPLSLSQWAQLFAAGLTALVFAVYLSPLGPQATISVSILLAGAPVAVSYAALGAEFSVAEMAAALLRYRRRPRRYRSGPGPAAAGYRVEAPAVALAPNPAAQPGRGEGPQWDR